MKDLVLWQDVVRSSGLRIVEKQSSGLLFVLFVNMYRKVMEPLVLLMMCVQIFGHIVDSCCEIKRVNVNTLTLDYSKKLATSFSMSSYFSSQIMFLFRLSHVIWRLAKWMMSKYKSFFISSNSTLFCKNLAIFQADAFHPLP
ncbi:MAG: hypothetical protein UR99_C0002G0043 [Candidatus Moranbacteria bacterium GW2011_GWD2_36_12]|nr:MAG: hypothetical protein UR99_C0002G0043 [Candidatus Moranbacteria bacterium GW2011_GWD2_36_12]